jgi:hypothetical protein
MKNKYTHLVDMQTDNGCILHELEANMDEKGNIYFVRNDDGVHAWHCNQVHKDNNNVVKIKEI